jgi:hypothetical protein
VHGGPPVSKDGVKLEEVAKIDRFGRQPGQEGMMCEVRFLVLLQVSLNLGFGCGSGTGGAIGLIKVVMRENIPVDAGGLTSGWG